MSDITWRRESKYHIAAYRGDTPAGYTICAVRVGLHSTLMYELWQGKKRLADSTNPDDLKARVK